MEKQSVTKGFAILTISVLFVKIISVLYTPILNSILGETVYGIYGKVYTIFSFIYVITNTGLPAAVSKIVSEFIALERYVDARRIFKVATKFLFYFSFIIALILIPLANPLMTWNNAKDATLGLIALTPAVVIVTVMSGVRGYFQGRSNMTPTAISQVIEQILNLVFSLAFAYILINKSASLGVMGATIGTTIGGAVAFIYLYRIYRQNLPSYNEELPKQKVKAHSNKYLLRKFLKFGIPITVAVLLQNIGNLIDLSLVNSRLITISGYTEQLVNIKYGFLFKFNTLVNVPITVITALSTAALPDISGIVAVKDYKTAHSKTKYVFKLCLLVAIPAAIGFATLSKPIFYGLFPSTYTDGPMLVMVGAIPLILMSLIQIQTVVLQGLGKSSVPTYTIAVGIVFKVIANYVLLAIPSINILGVIYSNILYFGVPLILNQIVINKAFHKKVRIISMGIKPLIAGLVMGVAAILIYYPVEKILSNMAMFRLTRLLWLAVVVMIVGVIYGLVLIIIGGIRKSEIEALSPRLVSKIPGFLRRRLR